MSRKKHTVLYALIILCSLFPLSAKNNAFSIAVFVPGIKKGNPTYEMLVDGVEEARILLEKKNKAVRIKVVEGGTNQGEWQRLLTSLALSGKYDLIVSSNPSIPALAEKVLKTAPTQKFLLLDGFLKGNAFIKTAGFRQYEQGFLNGYYAALISMSKMKQANAEKRIGLLAGQEYPVMNNSIRKGFLDGAQAVDKDFTLDFRVLGNWYDAAKAAEITASMIKNKADVILTICGGGNAGTVSAAREYGAYISWFDSPGYHYGKDIVIGGTCIHLKSVCSDAVIKAVEGTLDYGTPSEFGIADGAIDFAFDGIPASVPQEVIQKERLLIELIKNGTIVLNE